MNRYHLMIALALMVTFGTMLAGTLHAQETKATIAKGTILKFHPFSKTSTGVKIGLLDILATYGEAYDCFFTIEEVWEDNGRIDPISSASVEIPSAEQKFRQDLQYDLEELRQMIPKFIFEFNSSNPRVVHIIDNRLARQENYGLEGVIKSIDFKGRVGNLITEIGKQGIPVSHPPFMFSHEHADLLTKVHIMREGLPVRDALSNFIKLEGRGRILWIARTKIGQPATSYIFFP